MQGLFWQEFFVFVLNAEEFGEGCLAGLVHILLELLAELVAAVRAGVHAWKGKNKLLVLQGQLIYFVELPEK
jgi:hypothetical protein